ncbi:hypothetical protein CHUAL_000498 [Chamberlinius hualienensis]
MPVIPIINKDVSEIKAYLNERLAEPTLQRKVILVIVSVALLLDNMLYMVIVPIIPDYLRKIGAWETHREGESGEVIPLPVPQTTPFTSLNDTNSTFGNANSSIATPVLPLGKLVYEGENSAIGVLFASKAMIQLMINPFSGALIDRIGYDIPLMMGLGIMFISTAVFACGESYTILFIARSLQGVGSAFADTSGLAMIADRFTEDGQRTKALGIANAFISFGCLVAPPFGGLLYEFGGKQVPFLILSLVCLTDAFMVSFVMKPGKKFTVRTDQPDKPKGTPLWRLLMDPYIAVCAGALSMSNVALAFLEPTISKWMMDNMDVTEWQMGLIWLPAFFPHVLGVYLTVKLAGTYPKYQWIMAAGGLALEGLSCFIVPFATSYGILMIPLCGICFGIALIDTALLPTLGYLVDIRYVSVYGSIYAIADISYSLAYAFGPVIAGGIVDSIGFLALNIIISITNLAYCPALAMLRHVYDYKPFEDEANILMNEAPPAQYQTYVMHDSTTAKPKAIEEEQKNHLDYSKQNSVKETTFQSPYPTWDDDTKQQYGGTNGQISSQGFTSRPAQRPTNINGTQRGYRDTVGSDNYSFTN